MTNSEGKIPHRKQRIKREYHIRDKMENGNDKFIITDGIYGVKIYERIQSKVHRSVWHLAEVNLRCDEAMPTEGELMNHSKEIVENRKMSEQITSETNGIEV